MNTKYFTIREVADYFGVSTWQIYKLVDCGKIGHIMVGGCTRISKKDIESYERGNHKRAGKKERIYRF